MHPESSKSQMRNLVLLSGGFDSTIALYWAMHNRSGSIDALCIDYNQRHNGEVDCAEDVWVRAGMDCDKLDKFEQIHLSNETFVTDNSLLDPVIPVAEYENVAEAVQHNQSDTSYIPMRNAVFLTIAANRLLAKSPTGGMIITGFRGRIGTGGGFPDGSSQFADAMSYALSIGAGLMMSVMIFDPLNRPGRSRLDALKLAETLPGCFEALAYTMSCFNGTEPPCGHCLPCLRRAEGFEQYGREDPLLVRLRSLC